MKFGSQLKAHRAPHWKYHFVDYDGLKAHLKSKTQQGREFTKEDEAEFLKLLEAELDKVASFQALKRGEVQRRTEHCEFTIQQHQMPPSAKKTTEKLTLASFVVTESEINKITQDLQDLARFQRLNYTAFLKIVKKHDKHTGFTLRPRFTNQVLTGQPFHKESFAPLVSRLSTLYNIVRTGAAPPPPESRPQSIHSASSEEEELEQMGCRPKKSAFWVHPDSVMDLQMLILKYLPLVVYEPTPALNSSHRSTSQLSGYLASESPVSTVYLDNQDFDLYMGHVEHQDRTETVRLRWYGSERKQVWVEHQQKTIPPSLPSPSPTSSPTSSSSSSTATDASIASSDATATGLAAGGPEPTVTKHRFQIKAKNVPKLLRGEAQFEKTMAQMRRGGQKSEKEIQEFEESTRLVQSRIKKRSLQPVVQTFFNRTAFQVPGDSRVRITIDTDVVMVRERALGRSDVYERAWEPTELQAENYPFSQVGPQDIVRFPYAIMQIRTLTDPREEGVPSWVDHISQSHLVEGVSNFCKDQHAIATLYESRAGLLPFWLSDMDRDIRKPDVASRFPRRGTSGTLQDSNSNSSNSGSNDTLNSGLSTAATTLSDSGSPPPPLKKMLAGAGVGFSLPLSDGSKQLSQKSRKSILDPQSFFSDTAPSTTTTTGAAPLGVTFQDEVQDLMVHRMMIERQGSVGKGYSAGGKDFVEAIYASKGIHSLNGNQPSNNYNNVNSLIFNNKQPQLKAPKPVVGCLKKHGSLTSLASKGSWQQQQEEEEEDDDGLRSPMSASSSTRGYGSTAPWSNGSGSAAGSVRRKKVTFKSPVRIWWDRVYKAVMPSFDGGHTSEDEDLEAQQRLVRSPRSSSGRYSYNADGTRAEADWTESDPLTTSTTTATSAAQQQQRRLEHWKRMFWGSLSVVNIGLLLMGLVLALMNMGDGIGLGAVTLFLVTSCVSMGTTVWGHLSRMDDEQHPLAVEADTEDQQQQEYHHHSMTLVAAHKGIWVRTRLMPAVTFMCLVTAVGLNAAVRMRPLSEEGGSD